MKNTRTTLTFTHFDFSHPTTEPPVKSTTACTWFSSAYIIRVSPMQSDPACALPTPHPSQPTPTIPTRAALVCTPLGPTRPSLLPLQPACQSTPCMGYPAHAFPGSILPPKWTQYRVLWDPSVSTHSSSNHPTRVVPGQSAHDTSSQPV